MLISERILSLQTATGTINVSVNIYRPEKLDGMNICSYTIGWPENERKSYAAGVDSVQALQLALEKIGLEIYSSAYHKSGLLSWEKPGQGYGFPVPKNARDLLIGEDKIFDG